MTDETLRRMLRELGKTLSETISESPEVRQVLRRIHREGYSLFLLLDRKNELLGDGDDDDEEGESVQGLLAFDPPSERREPRTRPQRSRTAGRSTARSTDPEPHFKIDSGDLSFLRSIGIDPTRRVKSRKG